jgi:hypothetical protein
MTFPKLAATGLAIAAFALPLAAFAQDANPPDANPPEAKPPEANPAETKPPEAKPPEAKPAKAKAAEAKPGVFTIPGTDTTLELNGFIETDIVYDFDSADDDIRGSDWASFASFQPLDRGETRKARLYYTARTSRVGFTTNTPTGVGPVTVRVEGDFNSPSAFNYSTEATTNGTNFRIRHAYGEVAGLLIGQTWSNFMDLGSLGDTVDFNPHGAHALLRQPMIRYALKLGPTTLSASLENPQSVVVNSQVAQSYTIGREFDRVPEVTASFTFPFSFGHLNARGVVLEYGGDTTTSGGETVTDRRLGWGAGVSGSLKLGPANLVWSVQGGDGIGKYLFQSLFQGAAFVNDEIELWRTIAYHAGLTWTWSPRLRSNVVWTQTFFQPNTALARASALSPFGLGAANRRVEALFVNTFFSPFKSFELGVEYSFARRQVFAQALDAVADVADASRADADPANDLAPVERDNNTGTQHRVNALARYTFF